MADDWQVGDLALCVRGGRWTRTGKIYTVAEVRPSGALCGCGNLLWFGQQALLFEGHTQPDYRGCEPWVGSSRFRKIRPHEADAEDRETIALLSGRPAQVPT